MDGDSERLTFIGRELPQGFAARHVAIDPGHLGQVGQILAGSRAIGG